MYESLAYDQPVLFDKSETITDEFTIHDLRKKAVIVMDKDAMAKSLYEFFDQLAENNIHYEKYMFTDEIEVYDLNKLLYQQTMGTQLYIAAKWDDAVTIFTEAIEAGFTEDEIQVSIDGETKRYVYCMKCYTLNETDYEPTTTCSNCHIGLEVGPFFSKVRKGYIGYLIPKV